MRFAKNGWLIALTLCTFGFAWPQASPSHPTDPIPLWSAEVLPEDFTPIRNPLAAMVIQRDQPGIVFIDDNRIVVYEVESTGSLSSRASPDISSSFQLHASILSSDAGLLISTKNWPTRAHYSSIQAAAGGLAVRTSDKLTLVSKDFGKIAVFTLPNLDRCMLTISATQRTILSNCLSNELKISRFDILDGNTLQLKYSWSESPPLYRSYSVTDTGIVASDLSQPALIFSKFASRGWDRIVKSTKTCPNLPLIAADNWIFTECRDLSLEKHSTLMLSSMDGQVLMTDQFDKGENLSDGARISKNEQFVAFSLDTSSVERKILSEPSEHRVATHIAVYALDDLKKRILTIGVSPLPKDDYDFALSPDGAKLAVLTDRRVSVYSVPVN